MRQSFARPLTFLFVCAALASLTACSSNNKGKIVGRWKSTVEIFKIPAGLGLAEFKADGSFTLSAGPEALLTARYKLGMGNTVNLTNIRDVQKNADVKPARANIVITGDNMTWTEDKNSYTFVRMKDGETIPVVKLDPPAPPPAEKK